MFNTSTIPWYNVFIISILVPNRKRNILTVMISFFVQLETIAFIDTLIFCVSTWTGTANKNDERSMLGKEDRER